MKLISVRALAIDTIKVIKFARFNDMRGYFAEHYRKSDFMQHPGMEAMKDVVFVQCNESFSRKKTIRGLHFQWNPHMGKLVRTIAGRMIDIILDIRKGSPTFGKAILYDMPSGHSDQFQEWIWVPPGFAHGNCFPEDTMIEYFCSGEYNSHCEAGISPLADDIDWSLCDPALKESFDDISSKTQLMTDKDRNGLTVEKWGADSRSHEFTLLTCR
jgi:dTDP-4-dehydrorhamnose 3,5-epimerase